MPINKTNDHMAIVPILPSSAIHKLDKPGFNVHFIAIDSFTVSTNPKKHFSIHVVLGKLL